jgi:hypothetical protein
MNRWISTLAVATVLGCSAGPAESTLKMSPPSSFAGAWRSVTPSLEFLRLTVSPQSGQGGLSTRLTFSGVAWEGSGHIDGDSMVVNAMLIGSTTPTGTIIAHVRDAQTLTVRLQPVAGAPTALTFLRDD